MSRRNEFTRSSRSLRSAGLSRRSALGVGGLALAGGALAACGSNTGGLTGGGGGGGGDGTALSQWYHQYGEEGTQQAATSYAEAYPDADVSVNWVTGDYATKLSTALLSGGGVDVFENNAIAVDQAEQGRYADLTDVMEPVKDQFNEASLGPVTVGDQIWGVPMIVDPQHFYYRKSVFEDAGIAVPETWEDLVAAAEELTTDSQKGLFLGNNFDACAWAMVWAAGGTPLNEAKDAVAYNTPGYAEGLGSIATMQKNGVLLTGAPSDWTDPAAFSSGLAAITWGGCWALPALEAAHDDIGVFPHPAVGSEGSQVAFMGGWNAQVAGNSENIEAAKEFVKWLWIDQTEHQTDWSLSYGFHIPPVTATADQAEALKSGNGLEIATMAKELGVTGTPEWTGDIDTPRADAVSNILKNGADPATELAAAEEASNRAIAS